MLRVEMDQDDRIVNNEFDKDRVYEWESGLPTADDLIPLTQLLIPPDLAMAFSVTAQTCRSVLEVNRASRHTLSNLRRQISSVSSNYYPSFTEKDHEVDPMVIEGENDQDPGSSSSYTFDKRKSQMLESAEEVDSDMPIENLNDDDPSAPTLKRPRLVWTPQLHKRFVDVVAHLGIKMAVPKSIMQMMNVEGLTRENVASHLQKYRLYVKRMQGSSSDEPSCTDRLFASGPVPQNVQEFGRKGQTAQLPLPFAAPLMSMPVLGMAYGQGHLGMPVSGVSGIDYDGFKFNSYCLFREQQENWCGNKFGSMMQYPYAYGASNK